MNLEVKVILQLFILIHILPLQLFQFIHIPLLQLSQFIYSLLLQQFQFILHRFLFYRLLLLLQIDAMFQFQMKMNQWTILMKVKVN